MPSYRRPTTKQQRNPSHDRDRDQYLLEGPLMPGWGFERLNGVEDTAAAVAYWKRHRERLLRSWIAEKPGTRPHFWWKHEAPEPRRRIDGRPHPFDDRARTLHVAKSDNKEFWKRAYALHWGLPGLFIMPFDEALYRDFMANRLDTKLFEPEWSYLQRLGLLLPEDSP